MQELSRGGASGAAPRAAGPKGGKMNIWNEKNLFSALNKFLIIITNKSKFNK
jgi:hypothetical protein